MHSPHDAPSLFTLTQFARFHRKHPTRSEALLWSAVRNRQLGPRFRRQHPFAVGFIVDFYCPSYRLVVEIDGSVHHGLEAFDVARDAELAATFGVRVLRLPASLVERDLAVAVACVREALR
jgi:very-short-patch-repair endonuclease